MWRGGGGGNFWGTKLFLKKRRPRAQIYIRHIIKCTWIEALWFGIPEEIEIRTVSSGGKKKQEKTIH